MTLVPTLETGGLQASIVGFVSHTSQRLDHRVVVLHDRRFNPDIERQLVTAGAEVVRLDIAGAADRSPVAWWVARRRLRAQARQHRSRVMVSSLFEADLVARSARLPAECARVMRVVNVYPTLDQLQQQARSAAWATLVRWIDHR